MFGFPKNEFPKHDAGNVPYSKQTIHGRSHAIFHFLFGFLAEAVKLEPWKWNRGSGTAEVVDRGSGIAEVVFAEVVSRKW